jgi:hypothetical protein
MIWIIPTVSLMPGVVCCQEYYAHREIRKERKERNNQIALIDLIYAQLDESGPTVGWVPFVTQAVTQQV